MHDMINDDDDDDDDKAEKIARERKKSATERHRDSATKKLSLIPVMSVIRLSILRVNVKVVRL